MYTKDKMKSYTIIMHKCEVSDAFLASMFFMLITTFIFYCLCSFCVAVFSVDFDIMGVFYLLCFCTCIFRKKLYAFAHVLFCHCECCIDL